MPNSTNVNSKVICHSNAVQSSQQPTQWPKQPCAEAETTTFRGKSKCTWQAKQPNAEV